MPTNKTRINVTLPRGVDTALAKIARRDRVPTATKAAELLTFALEIEEDVLWAELASARDKRTARFVSHKKVWL